MSDLHKMPITPYTNRAYFPLFSSLFFAKGTESKNQLRTTLSNGYLGSGNDEERSEMRYVLRIAEFSDSSNLRTQIALFGYALEHASPRILRMSGWYRWNLSAHIPWRMSVTCIPHTFPFDRASNLLQERHDNGPPLKSAIFAGP